MNPEMKQAAKKYVDKKWSRWPLRITWRSWVILYYLTIAGKDRSRSWPAVYNDPNNKNSQFLFALGSSTVHARFRVTDTLNDEAPAAFRLNTWIHAKGTLSIKIPQAQQSLPVSTLVICQTLQNRLIIWMRILMKLLSFFIRSNSL